MRRTFLTILTVLLCGVSVARAQVTNYYISPGGSDANDCLSLGTSCATAQHVADLAPYQSFSDLNIDDGTYNQTLSLVGRRLGIIGNPAHPENVIFNGLSGQTVFEVQDIAVLTLNGLTINAPNGIAFHTRQFSIGDIQNVRFGPASVHISAQEQSRINCLGGEHLIGSATYHAMANDHSTIALGCGVTIDPGIATYAFLWMGAYSLIMTNSATFSGNTTAGAQYVIDNAELATFPKTVPGSIVGNICQHNCIVE